MSAAAAAPADPIGLAKRELRARCRSRREALGEAYRMQASQRICEHIRTWQPFQSATIVFAYLPMRGEVDLRPLFAQAPRVRWAIPRVVNAPAPHLVFHAYQPDRLLRHRYGMLEPDPALPEVAVEEANLIIVPGLGYTRRGHRLGYGGGYYDRLLTRCGSAITAGVCFEALVLEDMPHTAHDLPVEYLVTEVRGLAPCTPG